MKMIHLKKILKKIRQKIQTKLDDRYRRKAHARGESAHFSVKREDTLGTDENK